MKSEIISVGTELLLGQITDTNATWLAQRQAELGINCLYISQVDDNFSRLTEQIKRSWQRSDLIIISGGLGPTEDDLTREAISHALGESLVTDDNIVKNISAFFIRRNLIMPAGNIKQAQIISSCQILENPLGTAPGWWVSKDGKIIVCMPGIPEEMKGIWNTQVLPKLYRIQGNRIILTRTYKVLGVSESIIEDMIKDLLPILNPAIATYVKMDGIHIVTRAMAESEIEAIQLLDQLEPKIRATLGNNIYAIDDMHIGDVVFKLLEKINLSVSVSEDYTCGMVMHILGEKIGKRFKGGVVQMNTGEKHAENAKKAVERARMQGIAVIGKFDSDLGLAITSSKIKAQNGYADGRQTFCVIVSRKKEILSKLKQIDTTAPSLIKNRIAFNSINLLRKYLIMGV